MSSAKWKREDTEKLIVAMRQHPCLYNIKCLEYLDRSKKALAFNEILVEMCKSNPNISLGDIKQRWRNVRTQYVQELRMMNHYKKSGKTDIYIPKLWCFHQLDFLRTNTKMKTSGNNVEGANLEVNANYTEISTEDESFCEETPIVINECIEDAKELENDLSFKNVLSPRNKERKFAWLGTMVANQIDEIHPGVQDNAACQVQCLIDKLTSKAASAEAEKQIMEIEPPKPKRIKITSSTDELVQLATQRLKDSQNNNSQIAMVWGNKLLKMEKNQRIIAEKVINEVMFNGELGLLNFDTSLTNIGRVCNFNTSLTTTNGNNDLNHTRDSSIESMPDNNFVIRYATSPIPTDIVAVTNAESITAQENQQECIIADNDPLQNSIKIENLY